MRWEFTESTGSNSLHRLQEEIHAAKLLSYHFHSLPHADWHVLHCDCKGFKDIYVVVIRTDVAFQGVKKSNDGGRKEMRHFWTILLLLTSHNVSLKSTSPFNNKPFFFSSFSAAQRRQEHKQKNLLEITTILRHGNTISYICSGDWFPPLQVPGNNQPTRMERIKREMRL